MAERAQPSAPSQKEVDSLTLSDMKVKGLTSSHSTATSGGVLLATAIVRIQ